MVPGGRQQVAASHRRLGVREPAGVNSCGRFLCRQQLPQQAVKLAARLLVGRTG